MSDKDRGGGGGGAKFTGKLPGPMQRQVPQLDCSRKGLATTIKNNFN